MSSPLKDFRTESDESQQEIIGNMTKQMKDNKNAFDQYLCTPVSLVISTKVEAMQEFK